MLWGDLLHAPIWIYDLGRPVRLNHHHAVVASSARRSFAAVHQGRYQPQKRVMFGMQRSAAEKGSDIDIGCLAAGRWVRFMPDEHAPRGVAAEKPAIPVRAGVELSLRDQHSDWALASLKSYGIGAPDADRRAPSSAGEVDNPPRWARYGVDPRSRPGRGRRAGWTSR